MVAYRQGAAYESLDDFVNRCKSAPSLQTNACWTGHRQLQRFQLPEEPSQTRPRPLPGRSTEVGKDIRSQSVPYPVAQAGQHSPTGNVQEADVLGRQAAVVLPGASHSTEEVAKAAHDSQAHSVQRHHHPLLWDLELPKQVPTVSVGGHRIPYRRCPRSSCHQPTLKRKPQDRDTPLQRNDRSWPRDHKQAGAHHFNPGPYAHILRPIQQNSRGSKARRRPNVPTRIDPPPPPIRITPPPSKTPIALKDSMKWELDKMQDSGVIRRVTESTLGVKPRILPQEGRWHQSVPGPNASEQGPQKTTGHNAQNTHTEHPQSKNWPSSSQGPKSSQSWTPNQGTGQYNCTFQSSTFGRHCFQRLPLRPLS